MEENTMAISNDILSSTLRILKDEEVDNLYKATPLLDSIRKQGGVEVVDGGSKLDRPLILAEHSTITQLSSGYEPINLSAADVLRVQSYEFQNATIPIIITKVEEMTNKGPRALIDVAQARMKAAMGQFKREYEKALIANSSSVLTNLSSLNGVTTGAALGKASDGFFENKSFGQQINSIGGIAKSSFPEDFQHQRAEITAVTTGGTETIDALTEVYVDAQLRTPDGSSPNLILCSPDFFKKYKAQLYNNQRFVDAGTLDGGQMQLAFHGAALMPSPVMIALDADQKTDGGTPTGNTQYVACYVLNTKYIKVVYDSDGEFEMTDFMDATGYASRYAYIMCRMQMVVDHLASQGIVTIDDTL
jgi:hypothetical protein